MKSEIIKNIYDKKIVAIVRGLSKEEAVKAPLKHIPLLAVGGVNLDNIDSFIKAGVVGFGLGGNLINQTYIKEGNYDEITKTAKEFVSAVKN